jgi:GNAT superfamily N-acetyltransferase
MRHDEIQIAINWAAMEGWNPGLYDAELFHIADPQGFFIGTLANEPVAVGSAVVYDEHFAFCGLYIVNPDYRRQGYGIALTHARLDYVGERNAGIDGVIENIPIYERIGYRLAHYNARFRGLGGISVVTHRSITDLSDLPFTQIERYDRQCFPAPRARFLHAWITQAQGKAYGFMDHGRLRGYGVRRKCIDGHKIGPLFADSPEIAEHLLAALIRDIPECPFYLDISRANPEAETLVEKFKMEEVFGTGRMYLKGKPDIAEHKVFGITTFELG